MKGLEPKSPMDNLYTLDIDQLFGGMPTFKGVFHGYILFDEPNNRWIAVKEKQLPKSNEDIDDAKNLKSIKEKKKVLRTHNICATLH